MTLEQLGGLGEFVGALAILVSLVYVAREIHENSRTTRLATLQSAMLADQTMLELPARDRDLARVIGIALGLSSGSLNEDELSQFHYWMFLGLRANENLFIQHKSGMIDDETWAARSRSLLFVLASPSGRRVWEEVSNTYRADFRAWIASSQKRDNSPAA